MKSPSFPVRCCLSFVLLLATVCCLSTPIHAEVRINSLALNPSEAWVEDGTTWIHLRSFGDALGLETVWEDGMATLTGQKITLQARPGSFYITVNSFPFFVPGSVQIRDGHILLPLRILAQAIGSEAVWHPDTGAVTMDTYGAVPPVRMSEEEEDLYWLSRVISSESRGEPYEGQIAVGTVVLNRVAHPDYPSTIREVVFDERDAVQFEPVEIGTIYEEPAEISVKAAKECLAGARAAGDSLYFYAPALSPGTWIRENCEFTMEIGGHRFFR